MVFSNVNSFLLKIKILLQSFFKERKRDKHSKIKHHCVSFTTFSNPFVMSYVPFCNYSLHLGVLCKLYNCIAGTMWHFISTRSIYRQHFLITDVCCWYTTTSISKQLYHLTNQPSFEMKKIWLILDSNRLDLINKYLCSTCLRHMFSGLILQFSFHVLIFLSHIYIV